MSVIYTNGSVTHTFGNVACVAMDYVKRFFPQDFFNVEHISTKLAYRRLDILKSKNILGVFDKVKITARACVRLVAHHDARPLRAAHGVGAAVGQQIDIDVFRFQRKLVVVCFCKFFLSFGSR